MRTKQENCRRISVMNFLSAYGITHVLSKELCCAVFVCLQFLLNDITLSFYFLIRFRILTPSPVSKTKIYGCRDLINYGEQRTWLSASPKTLIRKQHEVCMLSHSSFLLATHSFACTRHHTIFLRQTTVFHLLA